MIYLLIKDYPGSPQVGTLISDDNEYKELRYHHNPDNDVSFEHINAEYYPEYRKEITYNDFSNIEEILKNESLSASI